MGFDMIRQIPDFTRSGLEMAFQKICISFREREFRHCHPVVSLIHAVLLEFFFFFMALVRGEFNPVVIIMLCQIRLPQTNNWSLVRIGKV